MVPRHLAVAVFVALTLVLLPAALGPTRGRVLGADATHGPEVLEVQPQDGAVSVVGTFETPPAPAAPGATGTESELNEGSPPPVPRVEDGVVGQGLGEPTVVMAPGAQAEPTPDDVIFAAQPVVVAANASSTAEPQVAAKGDRLFLTWNWGAAQSFDGGATFRYVDPFTAFPAAGDGFCCDQLAAYVPEHDVWVWVLQYLSTPGPTGTNVLRLALAQGDAAFEALSFTTFDLTAQDAGLPDGVWLDQPKLGWSDAALFLSVNGYRPTSPEGEAQEREDQESEDQYVAAVVWRLPLESLVAGALSGSYFTTEHELDPLGQVLFAPHPIRDSGSAMYLASHVDQATLGIWEWPDDAAAPAFRRVVSHTASGEPLLFPLGPAYSCPLESAADPVTSDWCAFDDPRIKTAWRRGDVIGYAWNVPQGAGWETEYPWMWAVEIDTAGIAACEEGSCVVGHPSIWLPDRAIQHAAVAPNAAGDLGGVALAGGGPYPLSCYALARPSDAPPDAGWSLLVVGQSDADSPEPRSGDYLGVAQPTSDASSWIGTCMTLHPGESWTETHVHVAGFGRRADLEP
jgi:hypothetical protein